MLHRSQSSTSLIKSPALYPTVILTLSLSYIIFTFLIKFARLSNDNANNHDDDDDYYYIIIINSSSSVIINSVIIIVVVVNHN